MSEVRPLVEFGTLESSSRRDRGAAIWLPQVVGVGTFLSVLYHFVVKRAPDRAFAGFESTQIVLSGGDFALQFQTVPCRLSLHAAAIPVVLVFVKPVARPQAVIGHDGVRGEDLLRPVLSAIHQR